MRIPAIAESLGALLVFMALIGFLPLCTDLLAGESIWPWLVMSGLTSVVGGGMWWWGHTHQQTLGLREGIAITSLVWVVSSLAGAIGLWLATPAGFIASWFECMSGFTTTGATIFGPDYDGDPFSIEALTPGVLLWRSLMQWMGGIGIVVISLALLPLLVSGSGFQLYRAEVPGLDTNRLAPRIRDTARILLRLYLGLTAVVFIALLVTGCSFFDALCHSLTTVSTGGFSPYNNSVEGLNSVAAEWVIIAGMICGGLNFALLLHAIRGRPQRIWASTEARVYFGLIIVSATLIALALSIQIPAYEGRLHDAIRDALFNTISVMTSTGYAVGYDLLPASWEMWPASSQIILVLLMIGGGCAGSTAGGIKLIRFIVAWKAVRRELLRYVEPARVIPVKIEGTPIKDGLVLQVAAFIFIYFLTFVAGVIVFTLLGHDMETAVTTAISCLSNIGPALGEIGPNDNFRHFGAPSQVICIFLMLLGRLEFLGVLMLFRPREWIR